MCIFCQSFVLNWITTSSWFNVIVSEGPIPQCAAGMNFWKMGSDKEMGMEIFSAWL